MYLYGKELGPLVRSIVVDNSTVSILEVPEQSEWLFRDGATAAVYPYTKTWEEAYADPWIIFHTSGTTGEFSSLRRAAFKLLNCGRRASQTYHLYQFDDDLVRCGRAYA